MTARLGLSLIASCLIVIGLTARSQTPAPNAGTSGSGALSPSVLATYEGHGTMPSGPLTLDLLVLWRGSPGWFDETHSAEGGGSEGVHRIRSRGRTWTLRFDGRARSVVVEGRTVALGDNNVLLLDEIDAADGLTVAGTHRIDGRLRLDGDALDDLVRRSPDLHEYLRCDARYAKADDAHSQMQLRHCERLRDR